MVSTRSRKTDYTISFPDEPLPVRSNQHAISKYYAHLGGVGKSVLIRNRSNPVAQKALDFNWFLKQMVPLKKHGLEESFDAVFSKIRQNQYPSWVRRTFAKDRRRKHDAMVFFKGSIRPFYDEIYGPNRFLMWLPTKLLVTR